jgi:hypothetical protein
MRFETKLNVASSTRWRWWLFILYDGASHRSFWLKQGYMREARGGYGGKEVPRGTLLDGEDAALLVRRRAFPSGVNCGHGAARGVGGSVHSVGGGQARKKVPERLSTSAGAMALGAPDD